MSTKEYLVENVPRIGKVKDYDENTPINHAVLIKTGGQILLYIPWDKETESYQYWFVSEGTYLVDDPKKEKHRYAVPERLFFYDFERTVQLFGCQKYRSHKKAIFGTGVISVQHAIIGAVYDIDYSKINGIEFHIQGLKDWFKPGFAEVQSQYHNNEYLKLNNVTIKLNSPEKITIKKTKTIEIYGGF